MTAKIAMAVICTFWMTLSMSFVGDAKPCNTGVFDWTVVLYMAFLVVPLATVSFLAGRDSRQ